MKVALSTSVIQRGKTGVAQYVFGLTRGLLKEDIDLYLLILEEDLPLFEFAKDKATIIPISEKWRPAIKNVFWHQTLLPRWLAKTKMDVIHIPSYRRMLFYSPCPRVTTIHDLAPFHVQKKYSPLRMFYGKTIVPFLARRQESLISVSQNTANDIVKYLKVPASQISVIHNGLDSQRFSRLDARVAQAKIKDQWQITSPYFLFVSRLEHPGKNHLRLIQAFELFKARTKSNWQLILGGSDWHGADVIHNAIKNSPYNHDIKALGFISETQLPLLYQAAGAFIYPSLFEGFGFPPLEAMASGCPVLCSPAGSLQEIVGNAAGLFDPLKPAEIADQMTKLVTNINWRKELVQAGLNNIQRFTWDTVCEKTVSNYRKSIIIEANDLK